VQIKVISVPVLGGDAINNDLNKFLRAHKILQVEQQLVSGTEGAYWSFCIRYIEDQAWSGKERKERIDYKAILSEADFGRFAALRVARKTIAEEEGVPAFAVFTDEELAGIAQLQEWNVSSLKRVKGIGEKKCEKYGMRMISAITDEKSE
jgi:superfamily II DNA helicase RecQ